MSQARLNLLGILLGGLIWWVFLPPGNVFIASLGEIFGVCRVLASTGDLFRDVWASLQRVMLGVGIAFLAAVALSCLSVICRPLVALMSGWLELMRPIPPIAWAPIAIIWFGIGETPAIAIVSLGAFFPIWMSIQQGLESVEEQHVWAAKSLGASTFLLVCDVIIPSVLPFLCHGLRIGIGLGWFCLVAAEMVGAQSGLGYGVQLFSLNLETPKIYCYILIIGTIGFAMNLTMRYLEHKLIPWRKLPNGEHA